MSAEDILNNKTEKYYTKYLEGVNIASDMKKTLVNSAFIHDVSQSKVVTNANDFIQMLHLINANLPTLKDKEWFKCIGDCYKIYKQLVDTELESTAYMLRTLHKSIMSDSQELVFAIEGSVTGTWQHDKSNITMSLRPKTASEPEEDESEADEYEEDEESKDADSKVADSKDAKPEDAKPEDAKPEDAKPEDAKPEDAKPEDAKPEDAKGSSLKSRLIMGFGPSASGKTFLAKQVIALMQNIAEEFPQTFLSIDGGIYRDTSAIYRLIVEALNEKDMQINNMVLAGYTTIRKKIPFEKLGKINDIFESTRVKEQVLEYLQQQKSNNFIISLYVPETLSSCFNPFGCKGKYNEYINYTGDNNWVGLLIYQHATHAECTEQEPIHKCIGCHESGTSREKDEGKRYSGSAWNISYSNGISAMKQAPKYRFKIHNTGKWSEENEKKYGITQHIPTFYDHSNYDENDTKLQIAVEKFVTSGVPSIDKNSWKYVFEQKPGETFLSREDIEKNIDHATKLLPLLDDVIRKNIVTGSTVIKQENMNSTFGGGEPKPKPKQNLNEVNALIQKKLPRNLKPFYDSKWSQFEEQYDTENPEISTILTDFTEFINVYLKSQKTMLTEHQLITMSMDILAKLAEKTNKAKFDEDARIKSLLEIALAIAFPEKSLSFDFNMPIILPEPSVRIGDLETMTNDIVPQHESKNEKGEVITVEEQRRERKDVTKTIYTEENPYTPAYYEHVLQSDGNNEELNKKIVEVNKTVIEAHGKVIEASL